MKLLTKFNLILILLFGAGGLIISQLAYSFLIDNARNQVMQQAELMMASARAVRDYTSGDLAPLLKQTPAHQERFLAETVPAFGATTTFNKLRNRYPDYSYKEATLNPTNLADRAADWETDIIQHLRDHPDAKQLSGERDTPNGRSLYLARPIAADPPCLECHSTPENAPPSMIRTYGSVNGFGWKPHEVVAAQIVSVPMTVPVGIADRAFHRLLLFLVLTLVVTILALDAGIYYLVIRPLRKVSENAYRVSNGDTDSPEIPVKGKDEISTVTASFNRMQVSLVKALRMLDQ
jgi:HAMP domain-containing protein